ncbi:lipopolysaccharide biosynthesis protein [Dokdonia sp. Hel_I_53]|uniref:lipopolysaccharide biosynthesis protein n=1 Tax=Dokdonia sp. Hel_I_53 TaxID=1566287 RepID=UPI0011994E4B|nr:oligosaccharide flippase family protein [Dokdonia sp. Hel_I_53]TVZ52733.1 O-antigen/teichoic acid export membrane protein [Dokdonia sp. Hel_I_53]
MGTLKSLFKHTFIYGLATVLPRILTALLTRLYTGYLPDTDAFGEVTIVFSYVMFLNVILTYGMETAFFKFFNEKKHKESTLSTSLISLLVTTVFFAVLAFLAIDFLAGISGVPSAYWKWVILIISFDTLAVIPFAYMRAQSKSTKYAMIKLLNVVISTTLSVILLVWLPRLDIIKSYFPSDKIELVFIALFAPSLITLLIVIKPYFQKWNFDRALHKKMLRYGGPILIAGLAFVVNESFDKILLERLLPEKIADSQVGIYGACYKLSIGMTLYATAFRIGIEPFFFSEAGNKNATQMYAQITKTFVVFGAIALFIYVVLVDVVKVILLNNTDYWEGMYIVPLILIAYLFFGIYQTLSVWYKTTDKTRYGAYISAGGAAFTILINVLLIPQIGYLASAIATCVAYGIMMIISYYIGRKHLAIPYDVKNILLYLIISISFSCVFFYGVRSYYGVGTLTTYTIGTFMTLVLSVLIGFKEKDMLLSLFKRK